MSAESSIGNEPLLINTTTSCPKGSVRQICRYLQHRLYEQGGNCQANLIVGGVDEYGRGVLRALHPHGSIDIVTYTALGSGSLAALSVLENVIREDNHDLSMEHAISLVVQAVKAGIDHDLGSGSQVDLCIITSNGIANYTRGYLLEESLDDPEHNTTVSALENGINGFGSVPYVVRSKRTIYKTSPTQGSDVVDERWQDILTRKRNR
jgi:Proteasome subunit